MSGGVIGRGVKDSGTVERIAGVEGVTGVGGRYCLEEEENAIVKNRALAGLNRNRNDPDGIYVSMNV
jgi:hypothetical protein